MTPLSRAIATTINELERTKFDVFPSGHTMITTVGAPGRLSPRAAGSSGCLLPVAVGLILSTVYCRYHYVVDVLAGLILAFVSVPLGDRDLRPLAPPGDAGEGGGRRARRLAQSGFSYIR